MFHETFVSPCRSVGPRGANSRAGVAATAQAPAVPGDLLSIDRRSSMSLVGSFICAVAIDRYCRSSQHAEEGRG